MCSVDVAGGLPSSDKRVRRTRSPASLPDSLLTRRPLGAVGVAVVAIMLGCRTAGGKGPASSSTSIIPSLAGIGLQADLDALVRALGTPSAEKAVEYDDSRFAYGDMIALEYPGLVCLLVGGVHRRGSFRVLEIDVGGTEWVVEPGLHVGMTADDARRRLPGLKKARRPARPGQKFMVYQFPVANTPAGGELRLTLVQNSVTRITVTSDPD